MTERAITFPKNRDRANRWTNAETGTAIVRTGKGYEVRHPAQGANEAIAATKATLAEARSTAKDVAVAMRKQIARAHQEALLAFAIHMAERAEIAIGGAELENALTGIERKRLSGYLTTALLFRETDPQRSIGWSQEILAQLGTIAKRETAETHAALQEAGWLPEGKAMQAEEISREEALASWGRVWAGQVPDGLARAFRAGRYAEAKRLADDQVAKQDGYARMAMGEGYYPIAAQEYYTEAHRGIGNLAETMEALHVEAQHDDLAREWYASAGFVSAMTSTEIAAGYSDWDAGNATEAEKRSAVEAAELALTTASARAYLLGGLHRLALLATKDTLHLGVEPVGPRSQAPQLDGGRPAHWGAAWLEVQHPAHIDMLTSKPRLNTPEYLRLATEPQAGRFFPGPM